MPVLRSVIFPRLKYNCVVAWSLTAEGQTENEGPKKDVGVFNLQTAKTGPELAKQWPYFLDFSNMRSMSGGSFEPGIEVGWAANEPKLWKADYGAHKGHADIRVNSSQPGILTQTLAVPWQVDFLACLEGWWPASRPIKIKGTYDWMPKEMFLPKPGSKAALLVTEWWKLGFIRYDPQQKTYLEEGRLI